MKIIHIIPSLQTGGAERLALDICIELNKRKEHKVLLIILNNINKFTSYDFIQHVNINFKLSLKSKNIINVVELQKTIEAFQPDIIHSHLFMAELVSRSTFYPKAKWFSHFHNNIPQFQNFNIKSLFSKNQISNYYEKKYILRRYNENKGNNFVCISEDTKSFVKKVVPSKFKTFLLPNAINYSRFYNQKVFNESETMRLINVGSFLKNKNQQFLIDVIHIIKNKNYKVELVFLGDGKELQKVKEKINTLSLQNESILKGSVSNVSKELNNAHIYVHSAHSEAFGLVLVEAMAAGLPVITLDGKGNRDLIEEGKNGYMLYEQDAEKFANTIIKLWKDKEKMQEISNYANEYAKQYDIVNYVNKLVALYQNAIDLK